MHSPRRVAAVAHPSEGECFPLTFTVREASAWQTQERPRPGPGGNARPGHLLSCGRRRRVDDSPDRRSRTAPPQGGSALGLGPRIFPLADRVLSARRYALLPGVITDRSVMLQR